MIDPEAVFDDVAAAFFLESVKRQVATIDDLDALKTIITKLVQLNQVQKETFRRMLAHNWGL